MAGFLIDPNKWIRLTKVTFTVATVQTLNYPKLQKKFVLTRKHNLRALSLGSIRTLGFVLVLVHERTDLKHQ